MMQSARIKSETDSTYKEKATKLEANRLASRDKCMTAVLFHYLRLRAA